MNVTVVREALHFACAVTKPVESGFWYLRIRSFQRDCHGEIMRAWTALPEPKPRGILLDMRGNPGGLVNEAVALADEWLEHGDVVRLYTRGVLRESTSAHEGGAWVGLPTVAIMSRWSASASEILAGALRDANDTERAGASAPRGARIVGELSYGKGTVQAVVPLPSGGGVALTIARYTTPSGRYIQGQGIVPHVAIEQAQAAASASDMPRESELPGALLAPTAQIQVSERTVHIAGIMDRISVPSANDAWAAVALEELRAQVARSKSVQ